MAEIKVTPNNEDLILNFKFNSPQQFFYNVKVLNNDTGQIIFESQGQWDGKKEFVLGKANKLIGSLLTIDWTIIDPAGKDNNFNAEAAIYQDNVKCEEPLLCTGTTSDTAINYPSSGLFINQ